MKEAPAQHSGVPVVLLAVTVAGAAAMCILMRSAPDHLIGAAFCHQIPGRSPEPGFPFCYRCCGMFSGIIFGIAAGLLFRKGQKPLSKVTCILWAASFILFLTDAVNSASFIPVNWYPESPAGRFLTAWPFGYFLAIVIVGIFPYLFKTAPTDSSLHRFWEVIFFCAGCAVSGALLFSGSIFLMGIFRILLCISAGGFLCILYTILIRCVSILRGRSCSVRTAFLGGCTLSLLQITFLGGIHLLAVQMGFSFL